jgi:hypothetical protein
MHPIEAFNGIKHEYGKFSFWEPWLWKYVTWPSEAAKENNFKAIKICMVK